MSSIQNTNTRTEQSMEHQRSRAGNDEDTARDMPEQVALYATSPSIKWTRGGLIGSGSFGDVYLGMDARTGFLMAVKQIELKASNEEDALNTFCTEIEPWKTLRHENVVQYFGKHRFLLFASLR
jgi:mitogen-activated protein kinase kinase kinase